MKITRMVDATKVKLMFKFSVYMEDTDGMSVFTIIPSEPLLVSI
jgi:hypothetical protein